MRMVTATIVGAGMLMVPAAMQSWGALVASDNAANAPYSTNSAWNNGDNGGYGFGPWGFNNGSNAGFFLGSSADNGTAPSGNIDTSGVSWGMFANSGDGANAYRSLTGALSVGQTFKIDMDNGWVNSGGTVGFGLMDANGVNQLEFYFVSGSSDYTIHDSGGTRDSGVGYTEGGLHLEFTLLSPTTYSGTITVGATTTPVAGTLIGSGNITQMHLFNANAGGGSQPNLYFNSISVVPEPTSVGLLLLGGVAALAARRRRTA